LDEIPGTINFFQEKNEFFIRMEILGSPVLMVGGCFSFTPLQKSIIKSLIKDLV
jgi:hypothetical protein